MSNNINYEEEAAKMVESVLSSLKIALPYANDEIKQSIESSIERYENFKTYPNNQTDYNSFAIDIMTTQDLAKTIMNNAILGCVAKQREDIKQMQNNILDNAARTTVLYQFCNGLCKKLGLIDKKTKVTVLEQIVDEMANDFEAFMNGIDEEETPINSKHYS